MIHLMAKSIKRNYFYSTLYSVLMVITPLVTAPHVSRVLQADGVGVVSFVASITAYFGLFADLGTYIYGRREISYVRDDPEKRSIIFWETQILRMINTSIALVIYLTFVLLYAKSYRAIFIVYAINILCTACDVSWFLAGLEEFGKIALRNIAVRLLDVAFVFMFIKSKSDVSLYAFGYAFFSFAAAAVMLVMWKYIPAYVHKPNFKSLHPLRNIKTILSLFVPGIAVQVYTVLDKTMIGIFTEGTFENGYYEQSLKISNAILPLICSLAGVISPRISYLFGKNNHEQISSYMYMSYNFILFLGIPICLGLIGVSDNFVPWFFGDGYIRVAGLLKITSFIVLAIGFNNATGIQYLIPAKMQTAFTLTLTLGATVNFCMNLVFIPLFGSYGAAGASVVAESVIALSQLYILRKELSFRRIVSLCWNYVIAGIVMLSALVFISKKLAPSPVHTFTMILSGALIYFCVLVVLRDKFFTENAYQFLESIKQKFHR